MKDLKTQPYQVWFPGEVVWELWFVDRRKGERLVDTCSDSRLLKFRKGFRRKVLALPAGNQIPITFSSSAFGEGGLMKGARECIKREGIDCDIEGIGVQPISGYPPRTVSRIDAPVVGQRTAEFPENLSADLILPAASILPLPENDIVVWTELGKKVLAVEKGGGTIHYQELEGSRDADCAREIRDLITTFQAKGMIDRTTAFHFWSQSNLGVYKNILTIDVNAGFRTDPKKLQPTLGMRPKRHRENEKNKLARKKRTIKKCVIGVSSVMTALLIFGAYTISYLQTTEQRECIARLQPETERLGMIKSQWEEMAPAVDRNASVLETWRKIFSMPGSSDVNIRRMTIGCNKVELSCSAKNVTAAFRYIDELAKSSTLAAFSWDYSTPETLRNGTALFELEGFRL